MAINPISLQNPYAANLNYDFMYNVTLPQQASGYNQGIPGGYKLGAVGGIGAGLGAYFFGGEKLGMNIYKDGKFEDAFLKRLEDPKTLEKAVESLKNGQIKRICGTTLNDKQYNALKKFAETGDWPGNVQKPEALKKITYKTAKKYINRIENINTSALEAQAKRLHNLDGSKAYLEQLNSAKSQLEAMSGNIQQKNLIEHIKKNPYAYGIYETDAEKIEKCAKNLVDKHKNKNNLLKNIKGKITRQTQVVEGLRTRLTGDLGNCLNDAKTGFKQGTSENAIKAARNFKINKAGKVGLIAAGVGLALGWLFGGDK